MDYFMIDGSFASGYRANNGDFSPTPGWSSGECRTLICTSQSGGQGKSPPGIFTQPGAPWPPVFRKKERRL